MISFPRVLKKILLDFLFGSTFIVSWYLMATIIGTLLVIVLCRYVGNMATMLVGFLAFLVCCALTNYANLFSAFSFLNAIKKYYPANFYNSFPAAVFWIALGKIFAEHNFKIKKGINISFLIISIVLLFLEKYLVASYSYSFADDSYIMLIPSCILLFLLIKDCRITIPYAYQMRIFSTITFCLHASLQMVIRFIFGHICDIQVPWGGALIFGLTLIGCMTATVLIRKLESRGVKWMKAFY